LIYVLLWRESFIVYNLRVQSVIVLFAKAPLPGNVKTRLMPPLSASEAASLHNAFVRDTLDRLRTLPDVRVELHTDMETDAWMDTIVSRKLQITGDLGLKMLHALETAIKDGAHRAMIVGSDSPTLPASYLSEVLAADADVALGPTDDGGFYAISARRITPGIFDDVRWSQPETFSQTTRAIEASGLTLKIGRPWFDVDEPRDLARLLQDPCLPANTRRWLAHARQELVDAIKVHADFLTIRRSRR
jgi:uncharacterized protein